MDELKDWFNKQTEGGSDSAKLGKLKESAKGFKPGGIDVSKILDKIKKDPSSLLSWKELQKMATEFLKSQVASKAMGGGMKGFGLS